MKIFFLFLMVVLVLPIRVLATDDFAKNCNSKMGSNVIPFTKAKREKVITPYVDTFKPEVEQVSLAGTRLQQAIENLFKKYEISDTTLIGGSQDNYEAFFDFNPDRFDLGIISDQNPRRSLNLRVARSEKGTTTINILAEGYVYTRKTRAEEIAIRIQTDRFSGEKSILVSRKSINSSDPDQTFKIRLRERTATDEQILESNRNLSREFQKTMGRYVTLYNFTVLNEASRPTSSSVLRIDFKGTVMDISVKSLGETSIFDLSVDGYTLPKRLKERVKVSISDSETIFKVARIQSVGARLMSEVKIQELVGDKNKLMTLSQTSLNAFAGSRNSETVKILLTPKRNANEVEEPVKIYEGALNSGLKLIAILSTLREKYSFGLTHRDDEPSVSMSMDLDIHDDAIWASIAVLPSTRWTAPEWQQKIQLKDLGGDVSLKETGENFVYRSKTPVAGGFVGFEMATEQDVRTRRRFLTIVVTGSTGEKPTVFRTPLTLKKFSSPSARVQSMSANESFRSEFVKLRAAYDFIPIDSKGAPNANISFTAVKGPNVLNIELTDDRDQRILFNEDVYSDSLDFGVTKNTFFAAQKDFFRYSSSTKMGGSEFHKFIEVFSKDGTTNKLMKLILKIPIPAESRHDSRTFYIRLVPKGNS